MIPRFASCFVVATLLVALASFSSAPRVEAQTGVWTTNGPSGGDVTALIIDPLTPTTVYAGTRRGGLFKSVDGGGQWRNTGFGDLTVSALAVDPQTPSVVYAATEDPDVDATGRYSVFRSTDAGASWGAINAGLPDARVDVLVVDPQSPSTVYAASSGAGVFKTPDGGTSWVAINTGLTNLYVGALVIDPQNPTVLYANTWDGVFKTTDAGARWFAASTGVSNVTSLAIDPLRSTTVYAGTWGSGVFKTTDGGATWTPANGGLSTARITNLAIDPVNPATLYAAVWDRGVFKTIDGGGTWFTADTGLPDSDSVTALAVDPQTPARLYAGTFGSWGCCGGIFKSTDGAGSWSWSANALVAMPVVSVAIDPLTPATLYSGVWNRGVFKSTDGGGSWGVVNGPSDFLNINTLAVDPQVSSNVYAGTFGRGLYKSIDAGATWNRIGAGFHIGGRYVNALAIDPLTSTILYAGTETDIDANPTRGGIFKSIDGGFTWTLIDNGLRSGVHALAIDPQNTNTVFAGVGGGVYKTIDGGASWSRVAFTGSSFVVALAIDPQMPNIVYAGTSGDGVLKSINGGASWVPMNSGLTSLLVPDLAIDPTTPSTLYAGIYRAGVFKSTNGGLTWGAINTGLTNLAVNDLEIDRVTPTTLYASTYGGVFKLEQEDPSQGNQPPMADAGPNQIVEATSPDGAPVTLDASGSSDPDGDPLTYDWSWTGGTATGVRPTVQLPIGTATVTLVVSDPEGASATDSAQITVQDTTPPGVAITSPPDGAIVSGTMTVAAAASDAVGVAGVQFFVNGAAIGVEDAASPYEAAWDTRTVPDGSHTLTARARDQAGNAATSSPVTVIVANGIPPPSPGDSSLVAHWPLDEGSGTTASDASGNGHAGILIGDPTWTTGQRGSALAFDGVDDHVQIVHAADLNAYPLSVATWIKTGSTSGVRGIVNKYVPFSFNGWGLFLNDGMLCAWYLRDSSNYVYPGGGCPFAVSGYNDDRWHHVAFVVDAAGGQLYVDGVSRGTIPWTGTPGPPTTTQAVHLARYPGAYGGAEYFPGLLDDVRIYDHALSEAEIAELGASSTWTASGLAGRHVRDVVIDPITPTTVYAAAGGVFKSTDGGATWVSASNGLRDLDVSTLAIDPHAPNIVYAGIAKIAFADPPRGDVYKSVDGGMTWVDIGGLLFVDAPVSKLAIDPVASNIVLAATSGGGIMKSVDGGSNWRRVSSPFVHPNVANLAINPQVPTTIYATHAGGVAKSTDGGETWIALAASGGVPAIDPKTPTTVYLGGYDSARGSGRILKSTDEGTTWTSVNIEPSSSPVATLVIDPQTPTTLYAGLGYDGVFKSTDGGATWSALNAGLTSLYINRLAIDPRTTTTLYAGTNNGVFKLEQNGAGESQPAGETNLTAHWKLNEGSGTVAGDSSGNGHDGTLMNDPTWAAGHNGAALAFDGVDDHVEVAHAAALNAYPLTVAAWIKTSSTAGVRGIVNKYVPSSFNGWGLFLNDGSLCAWYLRDSSNYVYPGGGCPFSVEGVSDNQWHHVAFVVDADGGRLYVDGLVQGSIAWTGTPGPPTTTQAIHLARYPGAYGGAEYLPGLLDEVRIYDRALSSEHISALASGAN